MLTRKSRSATAGLSDESVVSFCRIFGSLSLMWSSSVACRLSKRPSRSASRSSRRLIRCSDAASCTLPAMAPSPDELGARPDATEVCRRWLRSSTSRCKGSKVGRHFPHFHRLSVVITLRFPPEGVQASRVAFDGQFQLLHLGFVRLLCCDKDAVLGLGLLWHDKVGNLLRHPFDIRFQFLLGILHQASQYVLVVRSGCVQHMVHRVVTFSLNSEKDIGWSSLLQWRP